MKKIFMALLVAAFAFAAAPALHAADPAEGFWKSIDEQGKVTAFWKLWIEGGEYRLCDGRSDGCGGGGCHRHRCGRNARIKSEPYDQATQTETEKTNEDRNTDE